jgi:hypothetical protein
MGASREAGRARLATWAGSSLHRFDRLTALRALASRAAQGPAVTKTGCAALAEAAREDLPWCEIVHGYPSGGAVSEQAPSAARSSGRAARDQDPGTAGYSKRPAAHSDLAPEVPRGRAEGGSPRCSLRNLLWSPEPPVGLAGWGVAGNRAIGTLSALGGLTTVTTMAGGMSVPV